MYIIQVIPNFQTPRELPVVFFFHPGGFSDCSYKNLPGIVHMCMQFAARGIICVNIEYRRGVIQDTVNSLIYVTVQQQMAILRAIQDGRGGIRTVLQRDAEGWENDKYRIDENQIFLAGMSAGGLIAMNIAYYTNDNMIASIFPTVGTYTAKQILGPVNADYYYGDTSIKFQSHIIAVLDMWGGLPLPKQYYGVDQSGFFSGNAYNPPLIAFAGALDVVFPLYPTDKAQKEYFSYVSPDFYSENRCLPYPPNSPYIIEHNKTTYDLDVGSTYNMYLVLKTLGVPAEMYIDLQMHHGLDADCDIHDTACVYKSEFGTQLPTSEDVETYMVQRGCIFFQDNVNHITNGGTTLFVECENARGACDSTYTNCQ